MKILVLVKQTPDTEANLKLINNGNDLNTADLNFIINPYDEFAIEEALKVKTKLGGDVTIMSLGGDTAKDRIIKALAMGADRGVHIQVPQDRDYDSLVIANILKTAIQKEQAEQVLEAAKNAVAQGATISYAQGTGIRERMGLIGVTIDEQKEVIRIIVSEEQSELIFETIYLAGQLDKPGRGIMYMSRLDRVATYIPESM